MLRWCFLPYFMCSDILQMLSTDLLLYLFIWFTKLFVITSRLLPKQQLLIIIIIGRRTFMFIPTMLFRLCFRVQFTCLYIFQVHNDFSTKKILIQSGPKNCIRFSLFYLLSTLNQLLRNATQSAVMRLHVACPSVRLSVCLSVRDV